MPRFQRCLEMVFRVFRELWKPAKTLLFEQISGLWLSFLYHLVLTTIGQRVGGFQEFGEFIRQDMRIDLRG